MNKTTFKIPPLIPYKTGDPILPSPPTMADLFYLTSYIADDGTYEEQRVDVLEHTRWFANKLVSDCTPQQIRDIIKDAEESLPFMRGLAESETEDHSVDAFTRQRVEMLELLIEILQEFKH